jgi:hypothetical protein
MLSADTRGNNEDKKRRNPGTIFVPVEGQKEAEVVLEMEQCSPVENSEPTEGHLLIDAIRNRRNIEDSID